MTIRAVYSEEPSFPASEQHPDAVRQFIAGWWVDSTETPPTDEEVIDFTSPTAIAGELRDEIKRDAEALAEEGDIVGALRKAFQLIP